MVASEHNLICDLVTFQHDYNLNFYNPIVVVIVSFYVCGLNLKLNALETWQ